MGIIVIQNHLKMISFERIIILWELVYGNIDSFMSLNSDVGKCYVNANYLGTGDAINSFIKKEI